MVIIFGEKTSYECVGCVAEFCAICRGLSPVALIESSTAQHLYYITLSKGAISTSGVCLACKVPVAIDPTRYKAVVKDAASLEELIEATFPNAKEVHAKQLNLDVALKTSPESLSAADRRGVLLQVLRSLNCYWRELFPTSGPRAGSFIRGLPFLLVVLILAGAVIMGVMGAKQSGVFEIVLRYSLALWLGGGCVFWLISWWIGKRRWVVLDIYPRLKACLSDLKPTSIEIQDVLTELGSQDRDFVRQLPADESAAVVNGSMEPKDPWPYPKVSPGDAMAFCGMMFGLTTAYLMIFNN